MSSLGDLGGVGGSVPNETRPIDQFRYPSKRWQENYGKECGYIGVTRFSESGQHA